MDINIRKYVLQNLNNANFDVVRNTIEDAISIQEEKVLPGLGVMFEVLWQRSDPNMKNTIINHIVEAVKS
ncbi:MAG TPA: small acid-soluble spore protein SspI [Acholeplasmataceae bacterium]|jgi:small acid-soluble spore protein I (minor)|nr:small acid-soluble spore protein SspI [Acholeplasmataceae bacterium]